MNSSWGDLEDAALQGLALLAQIIYLWALRRFMDYARGLVGIVRGISYQSIAETLYVEPVAGRHSSTTGKPSISAIRNALLELEKAGLIERKSTGQKLIFFLPLASMGQSVQKSSDRGTTEERQIGATNINQVTTSDTGDGVIAGTTHRIIPNTARSDTPLLSVIRSSNTHAERELYSTSLRQEKNNSLSDDGERLATDWSLPEDWRQDALNIRPDWTPQKAQAVSEKFRDYWISKPAKDGLSINWRAVWRNWVRREEDRGHANNRANHEDQRAAINAKIDADARAAAEELMGGAPFR